MKVIFRVDGGREIGLGHIVRCLTLAEELKVRDPGSDILFVTSHREGQAIIEGKGHTAVRTGTDEPLQLRQLGTGGGLLVTDFLDTDPAYIRRIKNGADVKVIAIDNNTRLKRIDADVVVNANVFDKPETRTIGTTRYFLGPKYVILRREFGRARTHKKEIRDKVESILVLSGGGDVAGGRLILHSIEALYGIDNDISIRLVIGPTFPYRDELNGILSRAQRHFAVFFDPSNLADLMEDTDVAITAAGTVLYELASLGIPSIAIPTVTSKTSHQEDIAHNFEKRGACINLGRVPGDRLLLEKTILLMEDKPLREHLSTNGKTLVDAKGLDRALGMISEACTVAG